jgi:hypothetical protein
MTRPPAITLLVLTLAAAAGAQPEPEPAADPLPAVERVLVDRSLQQRTVRLSAMTASMVQVIDVQAGGLLELPREQVLALLPPLAALDQPVNQQRQFAGQPGSPGRMTLADGQSFPGLLDTTTTEAGETAEVVRWATPQFGTIEAPLEAVRHIQLQAQPATLLAARDDTVLLVNGDQLSGFVASVGAEVIVEKDNQPIRVPASRVVEVAIANPPQPAQGERIWLADGTAAAAKGFTIDSRGVVSMVGAIPGTATQPKAQLYANDLSAICLDMSAVVPLGAVAVSVPPPAEAWTTRRWVPGPIIADSSGVPLAADIEFPGPMSVDFALPAGVQRLGGEAQLPPSSRVWGDCRVVFSSVSSTGQATVLFSQQLNAAQPVAPFNVAVARVSTLRVTIDGGPSGPIQDRVVLRRPLLTVAP